MDPQIEDPNYRLFRPVAEGAGQSRPAPPAGEGRGDFRAERGINAS